MVASSAVRGGAHLESRDLSALIAEGRILCGDDAGEGSRGSGVAGLRDGARGLQARAGDSGASCLESLGEGREGDGPQFLSRLRQFLSLNNIRLLRDLMSVVDLKNVNHENICCLNTAVVLCVFANRRFVLSPTHPG
jgi:hypothetical protein